MTGAATVPAVTLAADPVLAAPVIDAVTERAAAVNESMIEAMQRDLKLSRTQAIDLRSREDMARPIAERLGHALAGTYAGAWLSNDKTQVVVAIADWSRANEVRRAGAKPVHVKYSQRQLQGMVDKLGALPAGVDTAYADLKANHVIVEARAGAEQTVAAFVRSRGVDPAAVRVVRSSGPVVTTAAVHAGTGYETTIGTGKELCSAGFGVQNNVTGEFGFVTAGHCGPLGSNIRTVNGEGGRVAGQRFPGNDYGFVRLNNPAAASPFVTDYAGGLIGVIGTRPVVLVSETICRSGRATQWQCGIAIADGVTATATNGAGAVLGTVNGLVKTTACANPSDSGGPFVGGQFALGVQSSSQELCGRPGAFSFFQPLAIALADFGTLRLLEVAVGDPPQPTAPLVIVAFVCESFGDYEYASFYCDLYWEGGTEPHQVSVSSNGSQARRFNDFENNHVSVSGQCDTYQDTYVSVSVFDGAGRRADANQNSFCPR